MPRTPASWRSSHPHALRSTWLGAALVVSLFHAVWEGHGVIDPALRNPDVAGIIYNARLFGDGLLPYVASAEFKPPGAFYLFTPLLELGGLRGLWAAAVVWGTALSLATGLLAAAVWGRRAGPRAAIIHAACAVVASDGDINYSFWMALPFTLAAACACSVTAQTARTRRRALWLAAGALSMFAVSIKPSAWTLAGLFALLLVRELAPHRRTAFDSVLAGVLGAELVVLLLSAPYLYAGRTDALIEGLTAVSRFGGEYVGIVRDGLGGRWNATVTGLPCVVEQMPGPVALALAGSANLFPRGPRPPLALGAWLFGIAALLGITTTLRFFTHDNAQFLPALAVLAVRPAGLVAALLERLAPFQWLSLASAAAVGFGAGYPDYRIRRDYLHFMGGRDHAVADICDLVRPKLPQGEPVLAWGWHAWAVYEHCDRRAPGRVFKILAQVTTPNTNTCNRGFGPMRLRPGAVTEKFFEDVTERPPSLVLWSTYFKEMGGDPLDDWYELRGFFGDRYTIVDVRGPFVALLRSDLAEPDPTASSGRARPLER